MRVRASPTTEAPTGVGERTLWMRVRRWRAPLWAFAPVVVVTAGATAVGTAIVTGRGRVMPQRPAALALPPAELGRALPGVSLDTVTDHLEGFTCGAAGPGVGEHPRTIHQCALEVAGDKGLIRVRLAGPDPEHIVAITTTLDAGGANPLPLIPRWAEIATLFPYEGSRPALARRWTLGAPATRGMTAIGDAYLILDPDPEGNYRLQIRARADWDASPEAPTGRQLAARFAPILRLSDNELDAEPFEPISIETFVRTASLVRFAVRGNVVRPHKIRKRADMSDLNEPAPTCRRPFRACYLALDVRDHELGAELSPAQAGGYARLQGRLPRERTVYWNVVREGPWTTVQYWFLYLFNDFTVNRHEGDWEHVAVLLDRRLVPVAIFYSSHHGGGGKPWAALVEGLNRQGDHPIISVARGSHANYFGTGIHEIEECFRETVCAVGFDFVSTDVRQLEPAEYRLATLTGKGFAGVFGTGNFLFRGRFRTAPEKPPVRDPRRRDAWRRAFAEFDGAPLAP